MDFRLDLFAVQGTLKSLLQHHSSKASTLQCSAFFIVQLWHPYMTTGKTIALTRWTFVGKVMSLLFNMLSRLVIAFLPRSKCLLISWLQSPSAVIFEAPQNKVCHCFHCFGKSLFLLHIWRITLLDRVFLADSFYLSIFWLCCSTLLWSVELLLRNMLILSELKG